MFAKLQSLVMPLLLPFQWPQASAITHSRGMLVQSRAALNNPLPLISDWLTGQLVPRCGWSPKLFHRTKRRDISFETMTRRMVDPSLAGCEPWAFAIGR